MEGVWVLYVGCLDSAVDWCKAVHRVNFVSGGGTGCEQKTSAPCFYLVCCHLQHKHVQCLWGQSLSLRGKKNMCILFHSGLSFICGNKDASFFPPECQSSATFYFSSGSINQLPLEILSSSFQSRWGVFSGGSQNRPPGLLALKPDPGSRILICMIIYVYHSFIFVFVC